MLKKTSLFITSILIVLLVGCGGGNLKLDSVQFANSVTKFGNFTKIEDTTFKKNQVVYVVAVVEGFISEKSGDKYSSWPIMTLKLRDENGKLLNTQQPFKDIIDNDEEVVDYRLPSQVKLETPPGQYSIEVIVEDGISGDRITSELPFEVIE